MTSVLLVGATVTLGGRIADKLLDNSNTELRLLVHQATPTDPDKAAALTGFTGRGATLVEGDLSDPVSLNAATGGIDVVISAVQGGHDMIVDGQVALARAAHASRASCTPPTAAASP
jgi:uncharacterized protein YbjT (DUF2867 family)